MKNIVNLLVGYKENKTQINGLLEDKQLIQLLGENSYFCQSIIGKTDVSDLTSRNFVLGFIQKFIELNKQPTLNVYNGLSEKATFKDIKKIHTVKNKSDLSKFLKKNGQIYPETREDGNKNPQFRLLDKKFGRNKFIGEFIYPTTSNGRKTIKIGFDLQPGIGSNSVYFGDFVRDTGKYGSPFMSMFMLNMGSKKGLDLKIEGKKIKDLDDIFKLFDEKDGNPDFVKSFTGCQDKQSFAEQLARFGVLHKIKPKKLKMQLDIKDNKLMELYQKSIKNGCISEIDTIRQCNIKLNEKFDGIKEKDNKLELLTALIKENKQKRKTKKESKNLISQLAEEKVTVTGNGSNNNITPNGTNNHGGRIAVF